MPSDLAIYTGPNTLASYLQAPVTTRADLRACTRIITLLMSDFDARTRQGTNFGTYVRQNMGQANSDISALFSACAMMVIDQLGDQTSSAPEDVITRLSLANLAFTTDSLQLTITVKTLTREFAFILGIRSHG